MEKLQYEQTTFGQLIDMAQTEIRRMHKEHERETARMLARLLERYDEIETNEDFKLVADMCKAMHKSIMG